MVLSIIYVFLSDDNVFLSDDIESSVRAHGHLVLFYFHVTGLKLLVEPQPIRCLPLKSCIKDVVLHVLQEQLYISIFIHMQNKNKYSWKPNTDPRQDQDGTTFTKTRFICKILLRFYFVGLLKVFLFRILLRISSQMVKKFSSFFLALLKLYLEFKSRKKYSFSRILYPSSN